MNATMYYFINEGLGMSKGKIAAQAGHAAVEAYEISKGLLNYEGVELVPAWREGGHYTKIVLSARDSTHLLTIDRYLQDRGFKTALIIDEGRTEIPAHSPTALGVQIVDKDDPHVAATFSTFDLMRDPKVPKPDFFSSPEPPKATIPEKDWDEQKSTVPNIGALINNIEPKHVATVLDLARKISKG